MQFAGRSLHTPPRLRLRYVSDAAAYVAIDKSSNMGASDNGAVSKVDEVFIQSGSNGRRNS